MVYNHTSGAFITSAKLLEVDAACEVDATSFTTCLFSTAERKNLKQREWEMKVLPF